MTEQTYRGMSEATVGSEVRLLIPLVASAGIVQHRTFDPDAGESGAEAGVQRR